MADAFPLVTHEHMPHTETARMKALRDQKHALLDQVVAIEIEMARLVDHEQRKVFAAFKRELVAQALAVHTRATGPSLDITL